MFLGGRLHFCTDGSRTVEWNSHVVAQGRSPFSEHDRLHVSAEVEVSCAFCGATVEASETDPIGIGVIETWRPHDENIDWLIYAHRECLLDRLDPEVREVVEPE